MRGWRKWLAIVAATAGAGTLLAQDLVPPVVSPEEAANESAAAIPAEASPEGAELTKNDLDAWLDGYMPYALESGGIAGAEVVVVKDGEVLTQRGFGYADLD